MGQTIGEQATNERLENNEALRRRLGDIVVAGLGEEIPTVSAHVGEDYAQGNDAEAVVYREIGAHFRFLAFTFAPWRMWDLHVGVVAIDDRSLSLGLHLSERAAEILLPELEKAGAEINAVPEHKKMAVEYQANLPPIKVAETDVGHLSSTISDLCRRMVALAARVPPPPGMRADSV